MGCIIEQVSSVLVSCDCSVGCGTISEKRHQRSFAIKAKNAEIAAFPGAGPHPRGKNRNT